ncbi:MAG: carbohydrate ABC transporter permease [Clostridia bacterium]|nr:carbohydrate ABC transporter permease [Clostridia bacterium]
MVTKKRRRTKDYTSVDAVLSTFAGRPVKYILIVGSMLLVLFPLYWLITSSFKFEREYLAFPPVMFPSAFTLESYIEIFTRDNLLAQFWNSFFISTMTTIITILIGSMAAYSVTRGPIGPRARGFFGVWFLVQKMYPAIATAIPVYLVIRMMGLIDTQLALIIMNTSFNLPVVIWLMMGFFEQTPYSMEESAMLDGCNFAGRFFRIVLPITKPGLIASAILTFVAAWNEFLFAVILTISRSKTLPVVIAGFITDRGMAWGPMAATAVVTLIPVVILTWLVQKDFVNGLAMGAVKG